MKSEPSVIMVEFNELSPVLMERFISQGKLPNFKRLRDESQVYITDAGEVPPNLEPWIQWITVHSGLSFSEHGIHLLGDGHKLKEKCIWDVASDAKMRVAICGSMNVRYDLPLNGYALPDPWTTGATPYPSALLPYFRFIQRNVQEYTNDHVPLSLADYGRFIYFMVTHGLSFSTITSILYQLLSERTGKFRWKRAQLLDKLQFDLFRFFYKQSKPHLATFFSNSTAHLQHMYWRNMEPDLFKVKPTAKEQEDFDQAILFGYQEMDTLIEKFIAMAGKDTTLVFCTALSQQPCLIYEEAGGKSFYRPRNFENLLAFAGITAPHVISPVMSEQFHIYFDTEEAARQAEERLKAVTIANRSVLYVERNGKTVFSGCWIFDDLAETSIMAMKDEAKFCPFFDIFYKIEGKKSGMHHPDGMLWIRTPDRKHTTHQEKVPLTFIAPKVLDLLGLKNKSAPVRYRELVSQS